jgi:hypothetical protein
MLLNVPIFPFRFDCCKKSYIPWEIKTPQAAKLTDVIYSPKVYTGCCSSREQIDIHLPHKASDRDKLLLLTASHYVVLKKK